MAVVMNGEDDQPPTLGLWFDPWLTCAGSHLHRLAKGATEAHLNAGPRVRRPKADQVERVTTIASCIIANLARAYQESSNPLISVSMMNKASTRYDRQGFFQLPKIMASMEAAGLILKHPGRRHRNVTMIEAAGALKEALRDDLWDLGEIGRTEGGETIFLTARTGRDERGRKLPATLIDYEETAETCALREELAEINSYLHGQRIELDGVRRGDFSLMRRFLLRSPGALPTFDLHGRIYGAFWITLPKGRRASLRINGEPIADLDFSSMFPRLAYALIGQTPPKGDLYGIPGLEEHRKGVKAGVSALLSTPSEMVRLPKEVKGALPKGWTASQFKAAVASKHPALLPLFGRDIAMDLMCTESRIMMAALRDLMAQGTPALPIHDGAMVPASKIKEAVAAMEGAALRIAGARIPVTETALGG